MIDKLIKAASEADWPSASKLLYDQWSAGCVECFTVKEREPWESQFDEKKIDDTLFYPFAAALCRDLNCRDVNGHASVERLGVITGILATTSNSSRGQKCGRMFRFGEPTYCCKECATDATCVLCHDCFKNSEHAKHKYKMHTSGGSGYCDCGDPEAFAEFPVCTLHTPNKEEKEMLEKSIPKELHNHLHNLMLIAVRFAVEVLCFSPSDVWPSVMTAPIDSALEKYQTVLFNDETHTYDAVIRALVIAINCEEAQAMRLASTVDREGRTVVCYDSKERCESVRDNVQRRTQRDTNRRTQRTGPLEVRVMPSAVVSCQNFAVQLINWIATQVKLFPPLASIVGNVLLHDCSKACRMVLDEPAPVPTVDYDTVAISPPCNHSSPCVRLVLADRSLWKSARLSNHQMLMSTILMHFEHKRNFGRLLVEQYDRIYEDFVDDDHDHKFSVVSMTVQVFTVPTIARFLVREHGAIERIVKYQQQFLQRYIRSNTLRRLPVLDFTSQTFPPVLDRSLNSMIDLSYLLFGIPRPHEWDSQLRTSFLRGATEFLRYLRDFQHMDEVKRQFTEHQLHEPEWESAFNLLLRSEESLYMIIQWAITDLHVQMNVLNRCINEIVYQTQHMNEFERRRDVTINGFSASCIEYDIAQQPVSVHQPLWRFCAALFTAPPEILSHYVCEDDSDHPDYVVPSLTANMTDEKHEPVRIIEKKSLRGFRTILMEMPLRSIVLSSQFNAQLWRRNGFSLANQMHNYASPICRSEMFDRDILMLQVVAAISEPNRFLIRVLDRFSLTRWATFGFEELPLQRSVETTPTTPTSTPEELSRITITLAEEMLHLLIMIVMERYIPNVGECSYADALKRELIHALCTGPKPFSQLERMIPKSTCYRKESVHDAVHEIGDFRRPGSTSMGHFHLKTNYRKDYNPFFYHYSKTHISQAEQYQRKDRANASKDVRACPPPIPIPFHPFYKPIARLVGCRFFCQILRMCFERHAKQSRYSSDGLLYRALFLCGIALNEQLMAENARDEALDHQRHAPPPFDFLENAEKEELLDRLQKLEGKIDTAYDDLLWWTIRRYKELLARQSGEGRPLAEAAKPEQIHKELDKAEKAQIAAQRKQQAMERMRKLQQNFKNQHKQFLNEPTEGGSRKPSTSAASAASAAADEEEANKMDVDRSPAPTEVDDEPEYGDLPTESGFPVCLGPKKSRAQLHAMRRVTCTLCQEDEVLSFDAPGIVCAAYVQSNRLFAQQQLPEGEDGRQMAIGRMAESHNGSDGDIYRYLGSGDLQWGTNVSTCAHTMHYSCYRNYVDQLIQRERNRNRQQTTVARAINYEKGEYLCPLCRGLCNCAMPLLPVPTLLHGVETNSANRKNPNEEFSDWVQRMNDLCSTPIYSSAATDGAQFKAHSRKRSHSERSLAEYAKESAKEPAVEDRDISASNLPRVISPFASILSLASPTTTTAAVPTAQAADTVPALRSSTDSLPLRHSETLANFLHETLSKLKSILPKSPKAHPPLMTPWDTVLPFLTAVRNARADTMLADDMLNMLALYSATGYVLRSVCTTLEMEKKPLFGAFNTRQQACVGGLVRLCAVAAFTAKPMTLRLLASRFLSPLILPIYANRPVISVSAAQVLTSRSFTHPHNFELRRFVKNIRRGGAPTPLEMFNSLSDASSNSSTAPASPVPVATLSAMDAAQLSNNVAWSTLAMAGSPSGRSLASTSTAASAPTPASTAAAALLDLNILNADMISMGINLAMLCGWSWVRGRQFFHNVYRIDEDSPKMADGSTDEHHCVRLALIAHLFQSFACHRPSGTLDSDMEKINISDGKEWEGEESAAPPLSAAADAQLDTRLRQLHRIVHGAERDVCLTTLKKSVRGCALEFLRSMAVFYNALTLVPPPEALKDPSLDEFEPLCRYLDFPTTLQQLLDGDCVDRLFNMWAAYIHLSGSQLTVQRPMRPRMLIDLPDDYSELINRAAKFRCPAVKTTELSGPMTTMCLVCGELLCSQSYCCQKVYNRESIGSCSYHMYHCGGNSCIFLRIRECQIIFITSARRGCYKPAPYVDEFGETDPGFKRGNPLHLNKELYRKYQRLWLHQEVAEEVMNQYELNYRNLTYEWHHF